MFLVGSTINYFFEEDFFALVFLDLADALGLDVFFFFSPKAAPQFSEYFLVVPLRKIVIV